MQNLLVAGCLRFGGSFTDTAVVMLSVCVCMRLAHVGMLYVNGMCAWHSAYRVFMFGHKVPFLSLLFLLQGVLVVVPLDAAVASWTYRPTVDCQGLWSLFKGNESGEKVIQSASRTTEFREYSALRLESLQLLQMQVYAYAYTLSVNEHGMWLRPLLTLLVDAAMGVIIAPFATLASF